MEKYVKISINELQDLLRARQELTALELGGVDNWAWYGDSFYNYLDLNGEYDDWDDFIDAEYNEKELLKHYEEVK